ncbi:hypothetical protein RIF29_05904 [Crotalaria pallida]|uniref:Uncharacterized protein n=1 Tax=Crotalaria pallida TaxID=3830 RepID=A0AAN9J424_CROPI
MAATTSSSTCNGFFNLQPSNSRDSSSSSSSSQRYPGCGKLDGVTMAFFASLERCSCIHIATEEDGEDDLPLILNDGNLRHRRKIVKGNKSGATLVHDQV